MNYTNKLQEIKKYLCALDNTKCKTIEEGDECDLKYDKLKDEIMLLIKQLLNDGNISNVDKECIYSESAQLLGSYIGCSVDVQKYGDIMKQLQCEGKLTQLQLDFFFENLDIGRWL